LAAEPTPGGLDLGIFDGAGIGWEWEPDKGGRAWGDAVDGDAELLTEVSEGSWIRVFKTVDLRVSV